MRQFDNTKVEVELCDLVEVLVGKRLAFLPNPDGTDSGYKAAIPSYQKNERTPSPFVTVEVQNVNNNSFQFFEEGYIDIYQDADGIYTLHRNDTVKIYHEVYSDQQVIDDVFAEAENGAHYTDTSMTFQAEFKCEGDHAMSIITELKNRLQGESARKVIRETSYSSLSTTSSVISAKTLRGTEYVPTARMVVTFYTISRTLDLETGWLDTITQQVDEMDEFKGSYKFKNDVEVFATEVNVTTRGL